MLFGAMTCPCGYNASAAHEDELPIELSYWEGLRAFWRLYWPTQAVAAIFGFVLAMIAPRWLTNVLFLALQFALTAITLFLFLPRICSRPYRDFSLVVVETAGGAAASRLKLRWRFQAWLFVWWRQILGGLLAALLAVPLNIFLSLFGLQLSQWIAIFAGVLVIGPIVMKMLIGSQFGDFRIEARRESCPGVPAEATDAEAATTASPGDREQPTA